MRKKIRWGLVSTARINRRIIPAIRGSKRGELVAVASRSQETASAYAREWEIPQAFGSYEAMLASDDIDAVYISLPNHLHAAWSIRAMEAGKHVLCEKPFALSVEEVDAVASTSRQTGRHIFEAFMYRHHPQTKLVEDWVRAGRLGEIRLFHSAFTFSMDNREGNVRLDPEKGGGVVWDVLVYPLSFAQLIFASMPETVAGQQCLGDTGVDETFSGQMHYAGGGAAQIASSFNVPFFTSTEIHGTKGRLELNRPFTGINDRDREILFTPVTGKPEKLKVKSIDPYLLEVEDMHAAILDGKPPLVTLHETRNHIQTAQALYESARSGRLVRLR